VLSGVTYVFYLQGGLTLAFLYLLVAGAVQFMHTLISSGLKKDEMMLNEMKAVDKWQRNGRQPW
jgi:hypothetical protein